MCTTTTCSKCGEGVPLAVDLYKDGKKIEDLCVDCLCLLEVEVDGRVNEILNYG